MWPGEFFIGRTVRLCGRRVKCGLKFAGIGVLYFVALAALAFGAVGAPLSDDGAAGAPLSDESGTTYRLWFLCMAIVRIFDIHYSVYTAVCRWLDPRRRKPHFIASIVTRSMSFVGGLALVIAALVLLARHGPPQTKFDSVAFYCNFVPLLFFYTLVVTPCGYCCVVLLLSCVHYADPADNVAQAPRAPADDVAQAPRAPAHVAQAPRSAVAADGVAQRREANAIQTYVASRFAKTLGTDDMDECAICLESFTAADQLDCLPCRHYFHNQCLQECHIASECPLCRQPIALTTRDLHK